MGKGASTEQVVREIHRHRRRRFSAEEKVRIVLEGLRGQDSVAELCRREGLAPSLYYARARVSGGGQEAAAGGHDAGGDSPEVQGLRDENTRFKQALHDNLREHGPIHLGNVGVTDCAAHRVLIAIDGKLSIPRDPNPRALRGP